MSDKTANEMLILTV